MFRNKIFKKIFLKLSFILTLIINLMLKVYMKRSLMLLGAAAVVATAYAGAYRDVTAQYIQNHNFAGGWQGALTNIDKGVGEVYNGAFNVYQTLPDMPAGEYTLTVNAFYRCGNNDFSKANMANGALHNAYIYINDAKQPVKGLFEEGESAPNSMEEAAAAFADGKFLNTVKVQHAGGDMIVGIANTGCYGDEWCCFDNFKLSKNGEDMTGNIANNTFSTGMDVAGSWDTANIEGGSKKVDTNKHGGVYRKTNASPFNYGQQIELPAGKYRFGILTFLRYGGEGDSETEIISCKGDWKWTSENIDVTPKAHYLKGYTEDDPDNAYVYVDFGATKMKDLAHEDEIGDYEPSQGDVRVRIKDIWEIHNGDYSAMPKNEPYTADYDPYETVNGIDHWCESGCERQSAAAFVNNPELYRQWAEFTLTAPTKVWVGFGKNTKYPAQYWCPIADVRLEQYDDAYGAVEGVGVDGIEAEGPAEYYNLQGVRVAEPTTGLYIVKQGNKVSKQLIRK